MPKLPNNLPNLRVEIEDYERNGYQYTVEAFEHFLERCIQANYSRALEGFRVEIPNQGTNPGLITIHNGIAINREGQIVDNESDLDAQRSYTFSADGTYFVEIIFTTSESDSDARAFWDTEHDNGEDPSGDSRPTGREFDVNVATRYTPDWRIHTPVATTAFNYTTDANSLRIPVAVITVSGGAVTGGTTFVARSVLEADAVIGATTLRIANTRIFPDAFDATIGGEAVTVTDNDRENGIITIDAPGLVAAHSAGARFINVDASAPVFLTERTSGTIPSSGTADARIRLFQGNEERGYALGQDPYSASGKSDVELKSLKDQIDFLAAELRQVKWGSGRASDIGNVAPPSSFSAAPRYYENSGGLQGARSHTVSVGDGATCWGDFNTTQSGSAAAALAAAYAALPSVGGTIYIKGSATPYAFATTVTMSTAGKRVAIVGDGRDATILEATGAVPALTLGVDTVLENLSVTCDAAATADYAAEVTGTFSIKTYNVFIDGLTFGANVATSCAFYSSKLIAVEAVAGVGITAASFSDCIFTGSDVDTGATTYDNDDYVSTGKLQVEESVSAGTYVRTVEADIRHGSRTVYLTAASGVVDAGDANGWTISSNATAWTCGTSTTALLYFPLNLAVGDRLTSVSAFVVDTASTPLTMRLSKVKISHTSAGVVANVGDDTSDSSGSGQELTLTGLTETVTDTHQYHVKLWPTSTSGGSSVYGISYTFDRVA